MDSPHEEDESTKLETTNKLLSDLERKLSFISTTSSNQTQQSHGSSVIVAKNLDGIGKQNIQSTVLQYIKNDENDSMFDPNDLYQDRQAKFMTTFGKYYNDDNSRKYLKGSSTSPNLHPNRSLHVHENDDDDDLYSNDYYNQDATSTPKIIHKHNDTVADQEISMSQSPDLMHSIHSPHIDTVEVDDPEGLDSFEKHQSPEPHTPHNDYNENDELDNEEYEDEYDYDEESIEEDSDLLLPPSPPRSPPREIDPDKLYGLYDFSGPDPSHCSLSRDEPVFLINDQDNYWWLIRKMTKDERVEYEEKKLFDKKNAEESVENEDEIRYFTDDEDGKIGFVPAECLETYGERLARLNCFINEEAERTSKDNLFETTNGSSDSYHAFNLANPINYQDSENNSIISRGNSLVKHSNLSKSNSSLRRNGSKKGENMKSVTFENLGELDLEDQEEEADGDSDDIEFIREQQRHDFGNNTFDIPHDEILKTKQKAGNSLAPPVMEEKTSEVLSDIYPNETPLVIVKNNSKKKKKDLLPSQLIDKQTKGTTADSAVDLDALVEPSWNPNSDNFSIGSYSPDTPPTRKPKRTVKEQFYTPEGFGPEEVEDEEAKKISNNLTHLRRSVILDRLTKVTSDIEQQIILDHYGSSSNELEEVGVEEDESEPEVYKEITTPTIDEHSETLKTPLIDQHNDTLPGISDEIDSTQVIDENYDYEYDFGDDGDDDNDDDDCEDDQNSGEYTPLTSTNSLNNGLNSVGNKADVSDKRKSKPVHEMFMPILGKFDRLADKLAELDRLL